MRNPWNAGALVRLQGVRKSWGKQLVLDGVDLELPAGQVVGIAGGNGAGKTTLLRIASGMILADAGEVLSGEVNIEADRVAYQRMIGLLSAGDRGLYARLTVRQNLDIWGGLADLERKRRRRRIEEVLDDFEIGEFAARRVDRLSMGQRQRVRLAMAFLHQPALVFLDEPRTSLDGEGVAILARALSKLTSLGGAAMWVSPEADEPLVTQAWVLEGGQLHLLPDEDRTGGPVAGTLPAAEDLLPTAELGL